MAGRIRSIKPEILEDGVAAALSDTAWRLWVSSYLLADDHGNLRATINFLLGQVFWSTTTGRDDVIRAVKELALCKLQFTDGSRESRESGDAGLWLLYKVRGQPYAHITGWERHQRVDRPGKPRCPGLKLAAEIITYENSGSQHELFAGNSREIRGTHATDLRPPTYDLRPPTNDQGGSRDAREPRANNIAPVLLGGAKKPPNWNPGNPISTPDEFRSAIQLWGWPIIGQPGPIVQKCKRLLSTGMFDPEEVNEAQRATLEADADLKPNYFLGVIEKARKKAAKEAAKPAPPPISRQEFSAATMAAIERAEHEERLRSIEEDGIYPPPAKGDDNAAE